MKIFVNRKIKRLFSGILLCALFFTFVSVLLMEFEVRNAAVYTIVCFLLMSAAILVICYMGISGNSIKIMEHAILQITDIYLATRMSQ